MPPRSDRPRRRKEQADRSRELEQTGQRSRAVPGSETPGNHALQVSAHLRRVRRGGQQEHYEQREPQRRGPPREGVYTGDAQRDEREECAE